MTHGDELERLAQALALVEGFQLLVLECDGLDSQGLHAALDVVQERVTVLRGVPPLIIVYDPRLSTNQEGSLRDEAWSEAILAPILDLSAAALAGEDRPWPSPEHKPVVHRPAIDGASVVAVIDGTCAAGLDEAELPSWAYLFHRINERRNALAREFVGTLAVALAPALVRLFIEEAPDAASIRSGHFALPPLAVPPEPPRVYALSAWYPGHLVQEAVLRRLASDPRLSHKARHDLLRDLHRPEVDRFWSRNSIGADMALHDLLRDLFSRDELRRLAEMYLDPDVARGLPGPEASTDALTEALLGHVGGDGLSRGTFLTYLARERPHRYPDIARVASQLGHELLPIQRRTGSPSPAELHQILVRLPRERLEQVVLLAGLTGDLSSSRGGAMRTRMAAHQSARAIVARAVEQGPEALERLSEALEIVASRDAPR